MPHRSFKFIDLFSGIGGFAIALSNSGGTCVGYSEIDKHAKKTYEKNLINEKNDKNKDLGDITKLNKVPDADIITGGVPCQSWSIAGKNLGFDDPRGKLWEDTIRVTKINKPKAFIYENVKGLADPRNKENLDLILSSFRDIGYKVQYSLLNSYDFGLPQNRTRLFIVGIREDVASYQYEFPKSKQSPPRLHQFFDDLENPEKEKEKLSTEELFGGKVPPSRNSFQKENELNDFFILGDTRNGHTTVHSWEIKDTSEIEKKICMTLLKNRRSKKYGKKDGNPLSLEHLSEHVPEIEQKHIDSLMDKNIFREKEEGKYDFVNSRNSSGINGAYRVYLPTSHIYSTLTATRTRDKLATTTIHADSVEEYKEKFINEIWKKDRYRDITPNEAARLQGFPGWFKPHENESTAHKQFGNAVSVPVVESVIKSVLKTNIL